MIDTRFLDVIPAIGATLSRPTRRAVVAGACGAAALAAASGVAPLGRGRAFASESARADQVVIYHTNDVHGHLQGDGSSAVGIDYVATACWLMQAMRRRACRSCRSPRAPLPSSS